MNTRISIVFEEIPQMCHSCGIITVTRPYGLNHEEICEECAEKDPALTLIRMNEVCLGEF